MPVRTCIRTRGLWLGISGVLAASIASGQQPLATDSSWRQHDAAADAAFAAHDYLTYRTEVLALLEPLSGHPGVLYQLARANALLGRPDSALTWLELYASTGLVRDAANDSSFASLRNQPRFSAVLEHLKQSAEPTGHSDTAFVLADSSLVTEDISYDPGSRMFFVSSVRQRKVVAVDGRGTVRDFATAAGSGLWSAMALAVDPKRRLLWVSTSATPQGLGTPKSEIGRTAVLGLELKSGRVVERFDFPADTAAHEWDDMALGDDGDLILSDSRGGGLWVISPAARTVKLLVPPGLLTSPQGPAVAAGSRKIFVADYVRGIVIVERQGGRVRWLEHPLGVAVNGIDGLRLEGRSLYAVQNGFRPNRIIRLDLDPALERVVGWRVLEAGTPGLTEPTHGVFVGRDFYFIANSGWNHLSEEGAVNAGETLEGAVIKRVRGKE